MSYVLEALRRAEAERHRGQVPGLDAQPLPAPEAGTGSAGVRDARWRWLAIGLVLALATGGTWWWMQPTAPPTRDNAAAPPAAPPHAASRTTPPPIATRPAPPLAVAVAPRPPEPLPSAVPPAPVERPAAASGRPASAAEPRVPRLQDLPEATRRQIPPMGFGGATDSTEPSARMLIINGQVFREGDEPVPGLTLERITLRGARFRWQDQRFEVSY